MALKRVVDKLEDVPEKHRDLYKERGGKYYLEAEDNDDMAEVRQALQKERDRNAEQAKLIKKWEKMGKTPEEILALLETNSDLDSAVERARGEARTQHEQALAQVNKKHEQALAKAQARIDFLTNVVHNGAIDGPAQAAISKHKGVPALLMPHVSKQLKVVEEDGKFTVKVVNAKGEFRVNGKGEPLTVEELVGEMREQEDFGRAFEGTTAGGGGMRPGSGSGGNTGGKTMKRAAFEQLPPAEQAKTATSGVSIVD